MGGHVEIERKLEPQPGFDLPDLTLVEGVAAVGAFFVFLSGLRDGRARFDRPATWVAMLFACLIGTQLLQKSTLMGHWEPLLPWWVFELRYLVDYAVSGVWNLLLLLAVIAAGDCLPLKGSQFGFEPHRSFAEDALLALAGA